MSFLKICIQRLDLLLQSIALLDELILTSFTLIKLLVQLFIICSQSLKLGILILGLLNSSLQSLNLLLTLLVILLALIKLILDSLQRLNLLSGLFKLSINLRQLRITITCLVLSIISKSFKLSLNFGNLNFALIELYFKLLSVSILLCELIDSFLQFSDLSSLVRTTL